MLSRIPVFIAARGNSELKIKKNKKALKYSFVFIRSMGLINQTYIISDTEAAFLLGDILLFRAWIEKPSCLY